jgi:hypothetical protein
LNTLILGVHKLCGDKHESHITQQQQQQQQPVHTHTMRSLHELNGHVQLLATYQVHQMRSESNSACRTFLA